MNRAKEHRTRPKSPPAATASSLRAGRQGHFGLFPLPSLVAHPQTIKRSEVSARRRLSTPPVPHFLRSSPSRARTKPQMPRYAPHQRCPSAFMRNAAASPTGRDRALSRFRTVEHASRQPLRRTGSVFSLPFSFPPHTARPHFPPLFPFSPPQARFQGTKKSTSNDVLFYSFGQMRLWSALAAAHRRSMGVSGSKGDRKAAGAEDSGMTHRLKAEPPLQQKLQSLHTLLSPQVQERLYTFNRIQLQTA